MVLTSTRICLWIMLRWGMVPGCQPRPVSAWPHLKELSLASTTTPCSVQLVEFIWRTYGEANTTGLILPHAASRQLPMQFRMLRGESGSVNRENSFYQSKFHFSSDSLSSYCLSVLSDDNCHILVENQKSSGVAIIKARWRNWILIRVGMCS